MMTLCPLLHLVETHSDELTSSLLERVHKSAATSRYRLIPDKDLRKTVYEIYGHLGDWLGTRNELDLERRYRTIGAQRAQQGIPFSQVAWAIVFTKENLWEFLKKNLEMDPAEVFTDLDMLELVDIFFSRAICFAAVGYEKERSEVQIESLAEVAQLKE